MPGEPIQGGPVAAAQGLAARWRRLLREDREAQRLCPEMPIEALYDKAAGLPAMEPRGGDFSRTDVMAHPASIRV